MTDAENVNFSLEIPSEQSGSSKRKISNQSGFYRYDNPNLEDIIQFIKNKELPIDVEKSLIDLANKTPHGSLANFRNNYKIHLNRINKNGKK